MFGRVLPRAFAGLFRLGFALSLGLGLVGVDLILGGLLLFLPLRAGKGQWSFPWKLGGGGQKQRGRKKGDWAARGDGSVSRLMISAGKRRESDLVAVRCRPRA